MERTAHDPIPGAPCKPSKIKALRRFDSTFRIRFRVLSPSVTYMFSPVSFSQPCTPANPHEIWIF